MEAPHHWQLTIDCHDPAAPVAVGVPEDELDTDGDGCDRIVDPTGRGPRIWFQPVPGAKTVKNRLHLDLDVADRGATSYADRRPLVGARVAALVALGASAHRVNDLPEHERYSALMRDPEGNEFCVS